MLRQSLPSLESLQLLTLTLILTLVFACAGSQQPTPQPAAPGETMTPTSALAQDYQSQCQKELTRARAQFGALEKSAGDPSVETILEPLNRLWMTLDHGLNQAGLYAQVHPDSALRDVADKCEQEFRKVITDIGLSRPIFDAVTQVDVSGEDKLTQRYIKNVLRDFRRAGVDKEIATRDKIRDLQEELVKIGQSFSKNIREDVRSIKLASAADLAGLPQDYIDKHAPAEDGKIEITTNYPDYIPFMTYAKSDALRLALYREFRKRGHPENFDVLNQLLATRHELATLLDYKNWAQYATEDKMIKSEKNAREFIEKIRDVSALRAKQDYGELLARLKKDMPAATQVGDWQKSYVEELLKKEEYNYDSQKVREYFSYGKTRDGILETTSKMFGVVYEKIDTPVWHESVEAYQIVDKGKPVGRFYLDMHPRDDKYKHAAAFPIVTGVKDVQIPEAALICNFPAEGPMEHDQVETFFHEFGHLIHHLFGGEHRWVGVSGFNTEWDFVEAPSQMLEEWAWEPSVLKSFASNAQGEGLPDELIAAMRKAREFGKGLWVAHQMFYAAVSLNYYDRDPKGLDSTAMMKKLQDEYSPFDYVDDTYFQLSFGHLDGYSAIYYTYMWSLVIAKDLFSVFLKDGLVNTETAGRYRDFILKPGGSKDAAVMVRDFLGRDYSFEAFADWLNGA